MTTDGPWQLRPQEEIVTGNEALLGQTHLLVAMTRMRNEAPILPDTLDYLSDFADAIIAYDDASTDDPVEILRAHPKVALVIANRVWEQDVEVRKVAEARHRGLTLDIARGQLPHDWTFCFDPDERVADDIKVFVQNAPNNLRRRADSVVRRLYNAGGSSALYQRHAFPTLARFPNHLSSDPRLAKEICHASRCSASPGF